LQKHCLTVIRIEYRKLITDLLKEEKSTGSESSLTNYSLLNETRMNRLEKTLKITPDNAQSLVLKKRIHLMVISEGWCDSAQLIPVLIKWLLSLMVK
jgi:hypothetical protein